MAEVSDKKFKKVCTDLFFLFLFFFKIFSFQILLEVQQKNRIQETMRQCKSS